MIKYINPQLMTIGQLLPIKPEKAPVDAPNENIKKVVPLGGLFNEIKPFFPFNYLCTHVSALLLLRVQQTSLQQFNPAILKN